MLVTPKWLGSSTRLSSPTSERSTLLAGKHQESKMPEKTIALLCKQGVRDVNALPGLDVVSHVPVGELLTVPVEDDVGAGAKHILPFPSVHQGLQINAIKFSIPEKDHPRLRRNQFFNLSDQLKVELFRKMPFLSFGYNPSQGQYPFLVDDSNHERHATPPHNAPIDDQIQGKVAKTLEQSLGERKKVRLAVDGVIFQPSMEAFYPALRLAVRT
jgi:hypothetical protein